MAAQSKSSDAAPPENPLKILGPATFLSVFCFCTTLASRPMMIARIMGDPALASSTLARLTASGALSEFVFSPVFGRLMDKYGRKPFLVGALLVSAAANGALFLNTDSLQFFLLEVRPSRTQPRVAADAHPLCFPLRFSPEDSTTTPAASCAGNIPQGSGHGVLQRHACVHVGRREGQGAHHLRLEDCYVRRRRRDVRPDLHAADHDSPTGWCRRDVALRFRDQRRHPQRRCALDRVEAARAARQRSAQAHELDHLQPL